jgi:membrane-associated phospholipid phosphatase
MIESGAPGPRRSWWIPPAALLCLFGLLLWQVVSNGPLTTLDVHVRNGIQDAATSSGLGWLAAFGRGCADLGDEAPAILSLLLVAAAAAWAARSWRPPLLALGAGIVLATVIPLKIWVGRPGPGEVTLGNATLGFFPSGHTADALCCYVTAGYLLAAYVWTSRRARQALGGLVLGLVLLTIFGLLWSNYHWLTDVLGSLCWCGAWLLLLAHLDQARAYPRGRR